MGGRVYILSMHHISARRSGMAWDGTVRVKFNSFPNAESRILLGGTILTVLRKVPQYDGTTASTLYQVDGRLQQEGKGPGSLQASQASFLQAPASCPGALGAAFSASTRPHTRPPVGRPLHNSLRVDCLPPSGAHLGNRISRTSLANDGRQTRRGGGAHAGPKDGAQTRASTSTTRDRFAPTPEDARLSSLCLGAKPSRDPHGAPRPSRLGCQETADDHGQAEQCIGPASFCSAAGVLGFALLLLLS